jgi:hypothetical protein
MKKAFSLLLFVSMAMAGTAVNTEDLNLKVTSVTTTQIELTVVPNTGTIYNVTVNFTRIPEILTLKEIPLKRKAFIGSLGPEQFAWKIQSSEKNIENYDFSNPLTFFDLEWDKNVALRDVKVNGKPIYPSQTTESESRNIEIIGRTDSNDFCEEAFNIWPDYKEKGRLKQDENCKPRITLNEVDKGLANDDGTFRLKNIELENGKNFFTLTVNDPGENTESINFTVSYNPPLLTSIQEALTENILLLALTILGVIVFLAIASLGLLARARRKKAGAFEEMKKRRIELRKQLLELAKKEANVGLSKEEQTRKKTYEQERVKLEEKLLKNDKFLKELEERAEKAVQEARQGTPSKQIRRKLFEEGYSEKEIELIKKFFSQKTSQTTTPP